MAVRVFVVDDSDVFIDAVREVLEACPDFDLVGQTHTGEAAVAAVQRVAPDLVLVDALLPGIDGVETCRRLAALKEQPFVVLCSVGDDPRVGAAPAQSCAAPFLAKAHISPSTLRETWRLREATPSAV